MNKVLITGATGFIGRSLALRLKAKGLDVLQISSISGDIATPETFDCFAQEDISHVFHLAGKTFVPHSWADPISFTRTNVLGTINALEFCRKKHASLTYVSAYVYGHPKSLPINEECSIRPSNPYALTKRLAEEACEFYARVYDLSVTAMRPFNVYGIGQAQNFLIPSIINQVLGPSNEITVKDLLPKRDYVYLEDLVSALAATAYKSDGYSVYNIGSGISMSVQDVIDTIQEVACTNKRIICDTAVRQNEIMDVSAEITRAGHDLGWHPEISFRAGIQNIINSEMKARKYE